MIRSIEEARAMVSAFRERILQQGGGASAEALAAAFASLAAVESHCSSARNGGDLGPFSRGQMQRVFEDAAFGLGVGEMSGLVESDSGKRREEEKESERGFLSFLVISSFSFPLMKTKTHSPPLPFFLPKHTNPHYRRAHYPANRVKRELIWSSFSCQKKKN